VAVYRFGSRVPSIGEGTWISDSAQVIGDVTIGRDCYVGHGVILRGDYGSIRIGYGTAIEEGAIVHINPDRVSSIGSRVTIGHGAIVHSREIEDLAVIGMGAVLSFDVRIGSWAIVAEGCVVPRGVAIPAEKVAAGVPARIVRDVEAHEREFWTYGKRLYVDLAREYPEKLERVG
jgi:carbonic anhydrase/acetyltransferase-like protein (isoleucine patch superfamily)